MRYFDQFGTSADVPYYGKAMAIEAGYESLIFPYRDVDHLGLVGVDSAKVIAAAGGPDWPRWDRYHGASIEELALPDSFSNVHRGHGRVAGVYRATKRAP